MSISDRTTWPTDVPTTISFDLDAAFELWKKHPAKPTSTFAIFSRGPLRSIMSAFASAGYDCPRSLRTRYKAGNRNLMSFEWNAVHIASLRVGAVSARTTKRRMTQQKHGSESETSSGSDSQSNPPSKSIRTAKYDTPSESDWIDGRLDFGSKLVPRSSAVEAQYHPALQGDDQGSLISYMGPPSDLNWSGGGSSIVVVRSEEFDTGQIGSSEVSSEQSCLVEWSDDPFIDLVTDVEGRDFNDGFCLELWS